MIIIVKKEENLNKIPTLKIPTTKVVVRKTIIGEDDLTYEEEYEIEVPIIPNRSMSQVE